MSYVIASWSGMPPGVAKGRQRVGKEPWHIVAEFHSPRPPSQDSYLRHSRHGRPWQIRAAVPIGRDPHPAWVEGVCAPVHGRRRRFSPRHVQQTRARLRTGGASAPCHSRAHHDKGGFGSLGFRTRRGPAGSLGADARARGDYDAGALVVRRGSKWRRGVFRG